MRLPEHLGGLSLVTDRGGIPVERVHALLTQQYWCKGIGLEVVRRSIEGSLCWAVLDPARGQEVAGFARVISDQATFAYLCDVVVAPEYRGKGLGTWMVRSILGDARLQGLRRFCLLTRDAHGVYAKFGFTPMRDPSRYMERTNPNVYASPG
ncbi:MAG: GNAT family N-acetyltransferase [Planctomycetota bacterium]